MQLDIAGLALFQPAEAAALFRSGTADLALSPDGLAFLGVVKGPDRSPSAVVEPFKTAC